MIISGVCFLYLYLAVIPWKLANGQEFMQSPNIYLYLRSAPITYVKCIQADTAAKNMTTRTLTQNIYVKFDTGVEPKWCKMRASYEPIEMTYSGRRVRIFRSVDEERHAVTNYTFIHTLGECAIVRKSKQVGNNEVATTQELWVNDHFNASSKFCEIQFMKVCNCDGKAARFNLTDCTKPREAPECP
uniref:Lipocalin n=1 Tax=Rhipicephalus zambeziensis TaxID=60191 RepID=A0A224YNB8_9ACAR